MVSLKKFLKLSGFDKKILKCKPSELNNKPSSWLISAEPSWIHDKWVDFLEESSSNLEVTPGFKSNRKVYDNDIN